MPCKTRKGPLGGKYIVKRKKGGGTRKVYTSSVLTSSTVKSRAAYRKWKGRKNK